MNTKVLKVYWPARGLDGRLRTQRLQRVRSRETEGFSLSVRGFARDRFREDSLARINFAEGVSTYILGFYVASIFHSSLAVELALLVGVASKRKTQKAASTALPRKLRDFSKLIDDAMVVELIDEPTARLADEIRLMRNTYVHYYNLLYLSKQARLNPGLIKETVEELSRDTEFANDERVKRAFANVDRASAERQMSQSKAHVDSIPVLDISAFVDGDTAEFFNQRTKTLAIREMRHLVLDEGFNLNDILDLMLERGRYIGVDKYERKRFDALDTLSWSHTILTAIGTLVKS